MKLRGSYGLKCLVCSISLGCSVNPLPALVCRRRCLGRLLAWVADGKLALTPEFNFRLPRWLFAAMALRLSLNVMRSGGSWLGFCRISLTCWCLGGGNVLVFPVITELQVFLDLFFGELLTCKRTYILATIEITLVAGDIALSSRVLRKMKVIRGGRKGLSKCEYFVQFLFI